MDEQRQDDQLIPIYYNSVPIQDVALKTYRKRWTIETVGAWHDGDYQTQIILYNIIRSFAHS